MDKHEAAKETRKQTKARRAKMECRVYQCKINTSRLNKQSAHHLKMLFVEGKWLRNHYLADYERMVDRKSKVAMGRDASGNAVERPLQYLSSQMKQSVHAQLKEDKGNLIKLAKAGYPAGKLHFVKRLDCIELVQPGITYKFQKGNKISVQGMKQYLKVHGLHQIPKCAEHAKAELIQKASGVYIHFTVYVDLKAENEEPKRNAKKPRVKHGDIALDYGIKNQVSFSNSIELAWQVEESPKLKRIARRMAKKVKFSKNWYKEKAKLEREHEHVANQRKDVQNKIIGYLKTFDRVVHQDDSIKGWHAGLYSKKVQRSGLGAIKSRIKKLESAHTLPQFQKTTGVCPECGSIHTLTLSQRSFSCCNQKRHRDVTSAKYMLQIALQEPAERRRSPAEELTAARTMMNCRHLKVSQIRRSRKPATSVAA